jgi:hypothetical protein
MFFCQRYLKKRGCVTERIIKRPWFINCQEQFTYPICGEYVAQTFNFSSLSKIKCPFQKAIFTKHIAKVSGK